MADDQTRVTLSLLQEEGQGDYINGNFIRVRLGGREGAGVVGSGGMAVVTLPLPGRGRKAGLHRHAGTPASHPARLLAPSLGVWNQGQLGGR